MSIFKVQSTSNSENKFYAPFKEEISSPYERAKRACLKKAVKNVFSNANNRVQYLAVDPAGKLSEVINISSPGKSAKFRELAQEFVESIIDFVEGDVKGQLEGATIWTHFKSGFNTAEGQYEEGDSLQGTFNFDTEDIRDFLNNKDLIIAKATPSPVSTAETPPPPASTPTPGTWVVMLDHDEFSLSLRDRPCDIDLSNVDACNKSGEPILHDVPVSPAGLGGLIGRLHIGTKIKMISDYVGAKKSWSKVKVISPGVNSDKEGFVDRAGLSLVKKSVADSIEPTKSKIIPAVDRLESRPVYPDAEDFLSLGEYVSAFIPPQVWREWVELIPHNNPKEKRFEVMVELDMSEGASSDERYRKAKRKAIKNFLQYYNCLSSNDYVEKLATQGSEDEGTSMAEEIEFYSSEDPKTTTVQYLIGMPHKYCDYRQLEQAPNMSIKKMIQEGIVAYQYAFSIKDIEQKIKKIRKVLSDVIKPGMENYDGKIENEPDIDFQIKKLDEFIPALKEYFRENNIKYRSDENDLVEIGYDTSLKAKYIRFCPNDGEKGEWRTN
tara:strand:- start:15715 stop:17367 length:1653 start_codon:yes stop_codon:yes gene_type:complete